MLLHALNTFFATVHPSWERKEWKSAVAMKVATMQGVCQRMLLHFLPWLYVVYSIYDNGHLWDHAKWLL